MRFLSAKVQNVAGFFASFAAAFNDLYRSSSSALLTSGVHSQTCHFRWMNSPNLASATACAKKRAITPNKTMWTCSPSSFISSPSPNRCLESSSRISNLKIVNMRSPMNPSRVNSEYSEVRMGWNASGVVSLRWWWANSNPIDNIRMKLMNATTTVSMLLALLCFLVGRLPSGGGSARSRANSAAARTGF